MILKSDIDIEMLCSQTKELARVIGAEMALSPSVQSIEKAPGHKSLLGPTSVMTLDGIYPVYRSTLRRPQGVSWDAGLTINP